MIRNVRVVGIVLSSIGLAGLCASSSLGGATEAKSISAVGGTLRLTVEFVDYARTRTVTMDFVTDRVNPHDLASGFWLRGTGQVYDALVSGESIHGTMDFRIVPSRSPILVSTSGTATTTYFDADGPVDVVHFDAAERDGQQIAEAVSFMRESVLSVRVSPEWQRSVDQNVTAMVIAELGDLLIGGDWDGNGLRDLVDPNDPNGPTVPPDVHPTWSECIAQAHADCEATGIKSFSYSYNPSTGAVVCSYECNPSGGAE